MSTAGQQADLQAALPLLLTAAKAAAYYHEFKHAPHCQCIVAQLDEQHPGWREWAR